MDYTERFNKLIVPGRANTNKEKRVKTTIITLCALVLTGVYFLTTPKPANAEDIYSCVLELNPLPPTMDELYARIANVCKGFSHSYGTYNLVGYQDGFLIVYVENIAAQDGMPPVRLVYAKQTPLTIGVGRITVENPAVFSFVNDYYGVTLNDACTYSETVGGVNPYWAISDVTDPSRVKECASFLLRKK